MYAVALCFALQLIGSVSAVSKEPDVPDTIEFTNTNDVSPKNVLLQFMDIVEDKLSKVKVQAKMNMTQLVEVRVNVFCYP